MERNQEVETFEGSLMQVVY